MKLLKALENIVIAFVAFLFLVGIVFLVFFAYPVITLLVGSLLGILYVIDSVRKDFQ